MNENELKETIAKYGYNLEKVTKFKTHDRLRVVRCDLIITINLRKHLEDLSGNAVLRAILTTKELARAGISDS